MKPGQPQQSTKPLAYIFTQPPFFLTFFPNSHEGTWSKVAQRRPGFVCQKPLNRAYLFNVYFIQNNVTLQNYLERGQRY